MFSWCIPRPSKALAVVTATNCYLIPTHRGWLKRLQTYYIDTLLKCNKSPGLAWAGLGLLTNKGRIHILSLTLPPAPPAVAPSAVVAALSKVHELQAASSRLPLREPPLTRCHCWLWLSAVVRATSRRLRRRSSVSDGCTCCVRVKEREGGRGGGRLFYCS